MAKRKKKGSQWRRTIRMINGERRWVNVRKLSNGKEEVHVVFPKKKKIEENRRSMKLKGSAKASYLNNQRSPQAKTMDKKRKAKNTMTPTNDNIDKWRENPGRSDLKGLD